MVALARPSCSSLLYSARCVRPRLARTQQGTVREDYSANGDAWNSFDFNMSRSRAYRWGEDGIGGISDNHQRVCFSLALWNGRDPILKERLFGLTGGQGAWGAALWRGGCARARLT